MSASVCWEPIPTHYKTIPTGAPQSLITAIANAGLGDVNSGITLNESDLPVLKGMWAAHSGVNRDNPYWYLVEAIEKHGSIRVWAVY